MNTNRNKKITIYADYQIFFSVSVVNLILFHFFCNFNQFKQLFFPCLVKDGAAATIHGDAVQEDPCWMLVCGINMFVACFHCDVGQLSPSLVLLSWRPLAFDLIDVKLGNHLSVCDLY